MQGRVIVWELLSGWGGNAWNLPHWRCRRWCCWRDFGSGCFGFGSGWSPESWLVGNLRLLIFSNHSNVFTAAKPFLQKTNLCISQNRFCSTDASLLNGLNSFTAPRSPPRIEPASTLPPLLPSFSFSRFRFGRPRRSPRLKRTEEQVGHWTMTKEEIKTHSHWQWTRAKELARRITHLITSSPESTNWWPFIFCPLYLTPFLFPLYGALFEPLLQPSERPKSYYATLPVPVTPWFCKQASLISNCCSRYEKRACCSGYLGGRQRHLVGARDEIGNSKLAQDTLGLYKPAGRLPSSLAG